MESITPTRHNTDTAPDHGQQKTEWIRTEIDALLLAEMSESTGSQEIAEALRFHFEAGGQRLRACLAAQTGLGLGLSTADSLLLGAVCEALHNASLIHDDIQDQDATRRGRPSVWVAFGPGVALCAGDFLISLSYRMLTRLSDKSPLPRLIDFTHERVARTIDGQCGIMPSQDGGRDSMNQCRQIAADKAGALIELCLGLPLIYAGYQDELSLAHEAGCAFGVGYQMYDDLLDQANDAVKERQSGPNTVHVLVNQYGDSAMAHTVAFQGAWQCFCRTCELANRFPLHSGDALYALGSHFFKRLEEIKCQHQKQ